MSQFQKKFAEWSPFGELEKFMKIPLDENKMKSILYDNFSEFIGLNSQELITLSFLQPFY